MEYEKFFWLHGANGSFRAHLSSEEDDLLGLEVGRGIPDQTIVLRHAMGAATPKDLVLTGVGALYLISRRMGPLGSLLPAGHMGRANRNPRNRSKLFRGCFFVSDQKREIFPPQHQDQQPGLEFQMEPRPASEDPNYRGSGKLAGKAALITGGDSGIGRAVAIAFAKEGADVAILYLNEHADADETSAQVEQEGRRCLLIPGDIGDETFCQHAVGQAVSGLGRLDILVNNAAEQHPQKSIADISAEQLERTFRTNVFAMFYLVKAALPHLPKGGAIINTASVQAYRGSTGMLDYTATKGAVVAFTRGLSQMLLEQSIRVNGVAPGPIWTPLIPSTMPADQVTTFGTDTPMKRPGQPEEVANCYVFLASDDASYMTGQFLHPNGGEVVNA